MKQPSQVCPGWGRWLQAQPRLVLHLTPSLLPEAPSICENQTIIITSLVSVYHLLSSFSCFQLVLIAASGGTLYIITHRTKTYIKGNQSFLKHIFSSYVLLFCAHCYFSIWYYFISFLGTGFRLTSGGSLKTTSQVSGRVRLIFGAEVPRCGPQRPVRLPGPRVPQRQHLPPGPESQRVGLPSPW